MTSYLKRASDPISSATGSIFSQICTISSFSVFESILRRRDPDAVAICYLRTCGYSKICERNLNCRLLHRFAMQFRSHIKHEIKLRTPTRYKMTKVKKNSYEKCSSLRSLSSTHRRSGVNHVRVDTAQYRGSTFLCVKRILLATIHGYLCHDKSITISFH